MSDHNPNLLKEINSIVSQCDRCGSCHLVCPLFNVKDKEAYGARGKINAARTLGRDVIPDEIVLDVADYCLLCGACTSVCASKVKTPDAMRKVRQYLAPLSKKQYKLSPEDEAKRKQAFRTLQEQCAGLSSEGKQERKVAYFFGCTARLSSPDAALATVKVLNAVADVSLVDNACCGLPALTRGDVETFKQSIKENIELYKEADTIVCDEAGCGDTLKHAADYFADDAEWHDRVKAFSQKVVSLSEYLKQVGYVPQKHIKETITYHEPCRLGRGQGIKNQPRELLKAVGEFREMPSADACCGGSCFFPEEYPDTADALLEKKRTNIEKTGAALVATECHRCLAQLKKAAAKSGGKFRAVHISEIL